MAAGCASESPAHATHIGGAPRSTVTPALDTSSRVAAGSNRDTSTRRAPTASVRSSVTPRPKMWKSGSTPSTTSSGPMRSGPMSIWSTLARSERVGEHRGTRRPGRPTGERQHRDIVGLDVDQGHRRRRGQVVQLAGAGRHDLSGTDGGSLPIQLGGGALGVERYHDGAEAEHRQVCLDELDPVAADKRHPLAPPDASGRQATADGGHTGAELAVGDSAITLDECQGRRRMGLDDGGQIHQRLRTSCRPPARRMRANRRTMASVVAGRIGR